MPVTRRFRKGDADSEALYSPCGTYRYLLTRRWGEGGLLPHNRYLQHIAATLDERHAALGQPPKITLAESGHMLHWEAPQAVAAALATFGQAAGDTHSKKIR